MTILFFIPIVNPILGPLGLAVVTMAGCLTGCLAGLEDWKDPPKNAPPPTAGEGGLAASAGRTAGLRAGSPLPLIPAFPPPKAFPLLIAEGPAPEPPQAGTNQGQLHIKLTSSKAKPKGHLNS